MSRLCLHDAGRKLDTAVVLVAGKDRLDRHISQDIVREPGLDALHQVLLVEGTCNRELAYRVSDRPARHPGFVRDGAFEEPMRRHPNLDESSIIASIPDDV